MAITVIMQESRPDGAGGTYKKGSTYTLADDIATYFIGLGLARRPVVRSEQTGATIDGDSAARFPSAPSLDDAQPAMVKTSSDGVAGISGGGVGNVNSSHLAAEGSFTVKRCPYLKTATQTNDAAGYTYQHVIPAETMFNAVRIGFLNGEAGAVTISKVIAGSRGSVTTGAASWFNVTFGGSASVTLPARIGTNRPSITYSDWIPLLSLARNDGLGSALPLLYIRTLIAAAQTTFSITPTADDISWLNSATPASQNAGRVWKTERQNVDAVNTTANWTAPTTQTHTLPLVVEFAHTVRGITVLNIGDSIRLGTPSDASASVLYGDAYQAVLGLTSPAKPVTLVNAAWGGDNSANYTSRAVDLISALRPDVVLFCPFTVNDGTPADYRVAWELGQFAQVLQAAKAVGAKLVAVNGMCNTDQGWNAAADAQRVALNTTLTTMGIVVVDQDSLVSDGASPARFVSGTSVDGKHPTSAIYAALAPLTKAAIQRVI